MSKDGGEVVHPCERIRMMTMLMDWGATVVVGILVASFWRGTWTLLDVWDCDQPRNAGLATGDSFCFSGILNDQAIGTHLKSGWVSFIIGIGLTLTSVSLMWLGLWRPKVVDIKEQVKLTPLNIATRLFIVYMLAWACVCFWRGVWYMTDNFLLTDKLTANEYGEWPLSSFWVSSVVGSSVCFLFGSGSSILAPPGIFLLDGPGVNPPPIAVTILSSYYSLTLPAGEKVPQLSPPAIVLDILLSFIIVPFFVVWYWRGSWLVLDYYLWGFSGDPLDVKKSIGWSVVLGLGLMFITIETVFSYVKIENRIVLNLLGRLRTYILAWGVVNFWRAVWYTWDEFLGGTSQWSAWIAHALGVTVLIVMGAYCCILAPASTMGVDMLPHPDCADDPLFSLVPVPADDLFFFGIGRQPQMLNVKVLPEKTLSNRKHHVRMSVSSSLHLDLGAINEASVELAGLPPKAPLPQQGEETLTEMEEELITSIWSSGSTGRRASYSSVRSSVELHKRRSSYLDVQRPDLDRRVSVRSSISSTGSDRRSSSFHRNR